MAGSASNRIKILQIGNYPPPVCGWSMQTKLVVEEIRRRGIVCDVLNLGENHATKSCEYIDVQGGIDYLWKVIRLALRGYHFHVHVNGQSATGYVLALLAAIVGRVAARPVILSWRGGLQQKYFPRRQASLGRWAFQFLFLLSGKISCNNLVIKQAIEQYGVRSSRVVAIPGFSTQHLNFKQVQLDNQTELFLSRHDIVFFCYVAFRPEYKLPILREAMQQFRTLYPKAGFVWLGFPSKELPAATRYVNDWPTDEQSSVLLLRNLAHDEFLTVLSRSFAVIRTPACDGVSASVLEALALGVPVIASENHHRPSSVITYREGDAKDLCEKLVHVTQCYSAIKQHSYLKGAEDNIMRTVDWVLDDVAADSERVRRSWVHAA